MSVSRSLNQNKIIIILIIIPYLILLKYYFGNKEINTSTGTISSDFDETSKEISELWKDILAVSSEQQLIKKETILKTINFMIRDVPEDDPELIDFVKSIIIPPSNKTLNLIEKGKTDFSQIGQSKYIDSLLNSKKNGFFIEAGGLDGESLSNTLFFEMERDWTGLLIEPVPSSYRNILDKNRNIYTINACIASNKPIISKFRILGGLSGRRSEMSAMHQRRMDVESVVNNKKVDKIAYIPCFSLYTILKAINVDNIDYFSLDVEGGEWDVLKGFKLDKINIKTFSIEYNGEEEPKSKIKPHLEKYGYTMTKQDGQDLYFIKN